MAVSKTSEIDAANVKLMELALDQAKLCEPSSTAFCVGCVITDESGNVVSTGYSRELPGNTHAEQCALDKLDLAKVANDLMLYSTMEPCSVRLSGNQPCSQRIIESGVVRRVFVGVSEPKDFVECQGLDELVKAGIEVVVVESGDLAERCLSEARRGH